MNKLKLSSRAKVFKKFGKDLVVVKRNKAKLTKEIKFDSQKILKRLELFKVKKNTFFQPIFIYKF